MYKRQVVNNDISENILEPHRAESGEKLNNHHSEKHRKSPCGISCGSRCEGRNKYRDRNHRSSDKQVSYAVRKEAAVIGSSENHDYPEKDDINKKRKCVNYIRSEKFACDISRNRNGRSQNKLIGLVFLFVAQKPHREHCYKDDIDKEYPETEIVSDISRVLPKNKNGKYDRRKQSINAEAEPAVARSESGDKFFFNYRFHRPFPRFPFFPTRKK